MASDALAGDDSHGSDGLDLGAMFAQVQKMQDDMEAARTALRDERVKGTAGGGVVTAIVDGEGELQSIEIAPSVVDPSDVEMLQDLVVAAVREATRRASELQAKRMGGVAGGLDLGSLGLGDLGGLLGGG